MKTLSKISLTVISLFVITTLWAAKVAPDVSVKGKVVDNKQAALEFANVVLQSPDTIFGISADEQGAFELKAVKGNYTLKISDRKSVV